MMKGAVREMETNIHSNDSKLYVFADLTLKFFLKMRETPPPCLPSLVKWYML